MEAQTLLDGTTYTRAEMFDVLSERGLTPPTARAFSDWVERGLIDRSTSRPGAGRGKGSQGGRWPRAQLELLAIIVAKREQVPDRGAIVALANIPTFLWLGWGEEYAPIRQVRRCVGTWAEFYQHRLGEIGRMKTETGRLARSIKAPSARRTDITAFARALANTSVSKRVELARDLLGLGDRVIDPENVGREFGAPGASLDSEKLLNSLVSMQYATEHAARDRLADLRGSTKHWFTDLHYRQGRQAWFEGHYEYQLRQPLLRAAGPADMYKALTLDDVGNNACRDVLMLIGFVDPRVPRPWEQRSG